MIKILQFVPLQLTICLVLGILVGDFLNFQNAYFSTFSIVLCFILLLIFYRRANNKFQREPYFNILIYFFTINLGCLIVFLHTATNHATHYSKYLANSQSVIVHIDEVLKPTSYVDRCIVTVEKVGSDFTTGKALLHIRNTNQFSLSIGERFVIENDFNEVLPPKNIYGFNYKKYLENKQIFHQAFLGSDQMIRLKESYRDCKYWASKLRMKINRSLMGLGFNGDNLAVINALLLGQRNELSKSIQSKYIDAGAIHILAVSGLHVGVILLFLNLIFKPIERIAHGRLLKLLIVLTLLWSYALLAGMSSSIIRAVTMFTSIAISLELRKTSDIYHAIITSAFILLLINPFYLFDVGFQLSYCAVFFIVWLQPKLYGLWIPKNKILNYFWKIVSVSIAAQLGVLPLCLYYFHQFPTLFFISNILIIPVIGIVLIYGIAVVVLALFNICPLVIADGFNLSIHFLNSVVAWVSSQTVFLIQDISFSIFMALASYLVIFSSILLLQKLVYKRLMFLLIAIIVSQGVLFIEKFEKLRAKEFIVFHKSRQTLIANRDGDEVHLYASDSISKSSAIIKNYSLSSGGLVVNKSNKIPFFEVFGDQKVLIVNELGIYNISNFKDGIILLRNSPKINLDRLIVTLKPKIIIADGSNYNSYKLRWKNTCNKFHVEFHQTNVDGAFQLSNTMH